MPDPIEIQVSMMVDVDGAPNAYGPDDSRALDYELNAHVGAKESGKIVGYLTEADGTTPITQGQDDPYPGFYIATTSFFDKNNANPTDPRRYVNAAEINYTLLASKARAGGVKLGDFCVVHSLRTRLKVFAIVGDSGNSSGAEGSAALLQRLGYTVNGGKSGGEDSKMIVVRYFPGSNPDGRFFLYQADLDAYAYTLGLDADFSAYHAGDPGTMVMAAAGVAGADSVAERQQAVVPLTSRAAVPPYPGQVLERDCDDGDSVKILQKRLRDLGYTGLCPDGSSGPLAVDGVFGNDTFNAVELFQARHTDLEGDPLLMDGRVGSNTWGALFGRDAIPVTSDPPAGGLLAQVLGVAAGQVGVLEQPPGSNAGPQVQVYQQSVGIDPGEPWCAAFVYYCFATAAAALKCKNPAIYTGAVLDLWNRASAGENGATIIAQADAVDDPGKITPGMIFVISTSGGHGHTGLVTRVVGGKLETIEGNTNDDGSAEGIGVFARTGRTVASINRGFVAYAT